MRRALAGGLLAALLAAAGAAAQTAEKIRPEFEPIAQVLLHPRCANCHPRGNAPLQGDEGRRHAHNVVRGAEDHGAPTFQCATCHGRNNNAASGVPGAHKAKEPEKHIWHLAPRHMGWNGMTPLELCHNLEETAKHEAKAKGQPLEGAMARAMTHLLEDPLVAWAWTPGADRSPPPIGHDEFKQKVRSWLRDGAQCRP